jgi:putative restriction endonuclease
MLTTSEVLDAFENIRRAQRAGVYAPHKPLLVLLALARVQHGEPRQVEYGQIDTQLKQLLSEFGPSSAPNSRHYPFWHLATDGLWELSGSRDVLNVQLDLRPISASYATTKSKAGFELRSMKRCALYRAVSKPLAFAY